MTHLEDWQVKNLMTVKNIYIIIYWHTGIYIYIYVPVYIYIYTAVCFYQYAVYTCIYHGIYTEYANLSLFVPFSIVIYIYFLHKKNLIQKGLAKTDMPVLWALPTDHKSAIKNSLPSRFALKVKKKKEVFFYTTFF